MASVLAATAMVAVATHGVCRLAWIRPRTGRSVLSRPMANRVRLAWMRAVSSMATVDSSSASTSNVPPTPGQTC